MSNADPRPTNRLAGETSLYLRQHMHNPVEWHPWGEEARARARAQDKPLLVSIGYSACHWCHVMERESFEDPQTAASMNANFVPIKVDREERPDVDQLYMDALMRLQGHGGWPLTVFCDPEGRPFYAGTYFPPEPRHGLPAFRQVLAAVQRAWTEQRDQVEETSRKILEALAERPRGTTEGSSGRALLLQGARQLWQGADLQHGGFGNAAKFPTPSNLDLLLTAEPWLPAEEAGHVRDFLLLSCTEMARRGLYDQLGGGFHRYCVDARWGVPHFEKMLYDQGPLLKVYADLWRRRGACDDELLWPIRETATWLRREMRAPDGGWYASQDADSEGEEGKFYVWRPEEVIAVLGRERGEAFNRRYAVSAAGNFDGHSVLWDLPREPRSAAATERQDLLAARTRRVPPATDTKRLAAWNALTASGLAYAGSVMDDKALVAEAAAAVDFVQARLRDPEGHRLRVFAEGHGKVPAFLDDLAALLAACLDLYRAGAGERYLPAALQLAEEICLRFYDADEGDLFLTPADGEPLALRPRSDHDGATPHAAGLAVLGLLRAAALSGRESLRRVALQVLHRYALHLERAPTAYPTLLRAGAWAEQSLSAALILGTPEDPATQALALRARRVLAPEELVIVAATGEAVPEGLDPTWLAGRQAAAGRPTAWVCRGVTCSLPVCDPKALTSMPAQS